ncbi:DUF1570 domain-containing protein, partial [Thalassotalea sp. G20_0]|uniref:DUF1570 domain-containing protein n=1 Tax=Thalassotalea sp. G20_0 TaxID=2821093 RepID=UPI001ADAFF49
IPVDMQTRLSVDTRQIFSVLSHFLSLDQLRQVHLEVHVFDSPNRFKRFKQQIAPSLSNNVSGFYSPNLNLVAINRQSNDETTLAIARHEAAHVIVSGLFGNIPTWFTEGVAEYFEQMSISGQLKIIGVNRSWMKLLTEQQRAGQLMTITEYLQYDRQSWRDQDQNTMYATAWSIVHFLMSSRQGKRLMTQYMDALVADRCQGINSQAFFNRWYRAIS